MSILGVLIVTGALLLSAYLIWKRLKNPCIDCSKKNFCRREDEKGTHFSYSFYSLNNKLLCPNERGGFEGAPAPKTENSNVGEAVKGKEQKGGGSS